MDIDTQLMDVSEFWKIIDSSIEISIDQDSQIEHLKNSIRKLNPSQIISFQARFEVEYQRSYSWDLWGAGYIISSGLSDDGFDYFRSWLMSKGRVVYEKVLEDPERLVDYKLIDENSYNYEFEDFNYFAAQVWQEKTGTDPFSLDAGFFKYNSSTSAQNPFGEPFDEDWQSLKNRYPKIWSAKSGNSKP